MVIIMHTIVAELLEVRDDPQDVVHMQGALLVFQNAV